MSRKLLYGGLGALALIIAIVVAGGNDIIDLPGWANVKGVDVPLVGDTDQLDCKLTAVDDAELVEVKLVDGDESTYRDFEYVWRNGNIVEEGALNRPAIDTFVVPGVKGEEQFYAISILPDRDDRIFCESITP